MSSKTAFLFPKAACLGLGTVYVFLAILPSEVARRAEYRVSDHQRLMAALDERIAANKRAGEKRGKPLPAFSPGVSYANLRRLPEMREWLNVWDALPK